MRDTRSELLHAAAEEFARHGSRGTRIQAIVKRAGVNERMIYHHFGSKDELYASVLADQQSQLGQAWTPVLGEAVGLEPYPGMVRALQGFYDALATMPLLPALWMHEALSGWQTQPLPTPDKLPPALRELYERGQHEGVFVKETPFEQAYGVAMAALIALPIFAPRFTKMVPGAIGSGASADPDTRDQVIEQLVNGFVVRPDPTG
ncbi:TetR/AcrR family transcriptional regulator [Streptomyces sp. SL13]|uniref:TetR/AcrR family transcriptional regulator n=1 Tax=Streptantibioticus silvisoli TaxID=2705255 RepID=A0AA90GZX2_9ACTN|nr:TetR/AcrR family transcriptional regulator [Streptantibioticus silvisoli]MDI5962388.1 TetR/AcrR family transcriptional regulator [Streptantibioticus silvisoli]MDI5967900.1 TetR/AcrR family transcriptional regulator [Streptantibioticus silvisoli]